MTTELKKGDFLWKRLDPGEYCAFVVEGLVEIVNENKSGNELIMGIFGPGDMIGLSAILKKTQYPASAIVSSKNSKILKFFIRSIDRDLAGQDWENMLNWQRERLLIHEQILRDKIMILGAGDLSARIIELFDNLQMRFSKSQDVNPNKIIIPISITKTQIAKIIEARVETVIRILNKWEKADYLKMGDQSVILNNFERLRSQEGSK